MPQDPNLYGQRPAKRQKKGIPLSSSLDFASQLTSLLSTPASDPSSSASSSAVAFGRARPSKNKDDIFSVKAKRKAGASTSTAENDDGKDGAKIQLKEVRGTEDEKHELARARRKMEEKARLYAAMKRGDYIAKEGEAAPLVDFDRKWAERHPEDADNNNNTYSSSGTDDSDADDADQEMVEFKDEFGRTRRATRAEAARYERQRHRSALGAAELESMAAKPTKAPERLIFGDVIQSAAFNPEDDTRTKMADLAAKRDKSPTPPPDAHFDGRAEIRTKGVGFYQFSHDDEDARRREMEALERERDTTERVRREREEQKEKRRREIEERRRKIGAKRAEKMAESFLDGLAGEMGTSGAGAGGSGSDAGGKRKESEEGGPQKSTT
ncbi:hypothetical protein F5Y00DRAFT_234811 [Daldinia vernicosa]|uniref:uncharacterized protein n=1 Tax=Daldinia vernicosa TaxID=114800 RepID=UPI00200760D2|nr:uncharacterized protein F5Y00DRAFT_234811 [Daldinia vernicosa]KAI0849780.1 hypothetical protein F5Y00DRAFT_234811 [Daldinia vernicosa]